MLTAPHLCLLSVAHQPYEMFVTSSGTTTEFETYEFDVFTKRIVVAGYVTGDESISIAEVSFTT